jgi:septal ring factor EnvC (AmiA/AmiB activator)
MRVPALYLAALLAVLPSTSSGAMAQKIESTVEQIRAERDELRLQLRLQEQGANARMAPSVIATREQIAQLEAAILKGEAASSELRKEIATLEAQTKQLGLEKQQLLNVQTSLTSGLIAAIITAVVAAVGAMLSVRRSRIDGDHRRLEIIEKAQAITELGLTVPPEMVSRYFAGVAPTRSPSNSPSPPT